MTDNSSRFSKDYKAAKTSKSKPTEKGTVIYDPRGQWDYPGQITKIPGGNITMQDVNYPVLGIDNFGNQQMMYPGMDYTFPNADNVTEYPQMKRGGMPYKYTSQNIKTSINSLFTRNEMLFGPSGKHLFKPKMQTGGWLDKYQEGGGTLPKNDATHYYTSDINDPKFQLEKDSIKLNEFSNKKYNYLKKLGDGDLDVDASKLADFFNHDPFNTVKESPLKYINDIKSKTGKLPQDKYNSYTVQGVYRNPNGSNDILGSYNMGMYKNRTQKVIYQPEEKPDSEVVKQPIIPFKHK